MMDTPARTTHTAIRFQFQPSADRTPFLTDYCVDGNAEDLRGIFNGAEEAYTRLAHGADAYLGLVELEKLECTGVDIWRYREGDENWDRFSNPEAVRKTDYEEGFSEFDVTDGEKQHHCLGATATREYLIRNKLEI